MIRAEEALSKLIEGNSRFVNNQREFKNQTVADAKRLADSQAPFAVLISCADSRVLPEVIFDCGMGDLFTIRIAGNIINDDIIGSISYAVNCLGTNLVFVLGHQNCGAVMSAKSGEISCNYINSLVNNISEDVKNTNSQEQAEIKNVEYSVKKLKQLNGEIGEKISSGNVFVQGAYYSFHTGKVSLI